MIRDTEPHERALFSIDPNAIGRTRTQSKAPSAGLRNGLATPHPLKQSAVSRLLGNEMLREIRQSSNAPSHGQVDVEVLLKGAEKLCDVYNVAGAPDKIRALRSRHGNVASSIAVLEEKVTRQQSNLDRKNPAIKSDETEVEDKVDQDVTSHENPVVYTMEDFQLEEDEIRELEARKKALEDRVSGMERDLGGLLK